MAFQQIDPAGSPRRPRSTPSCLRGAAAVGIALVVALASCSLGNESLRPPDAETDPLSTEATLTALTPAVDPVIDVLKQARSFVNTDNMASTMLILSNFPTLWGEATAVIEPLAGERWPPIEAAANRLITIFDGSSIPEAATARPAIEDLMEKLQSLMIP